jgi:hypothetical protein
MNHAEVISKLKKTGIPTHDAKVIADCVVTRKSCSWVNTDEVSKDAVRSLLELIKQDDYKIELSIKSVATRNKYIWEVKVLD